ncbi:alginate lyase family protein [Mesonia aquimarina]|uniref:alginate lyase family protein n=1 Tax=Mesonia aquimarina TaxID=1504967 RepID=UPI000EF5BF88|nr:alginate lyase family protein [Mesonia aquimarina]
MKYFDLLNNMGLRYVSFRVQYALAQKFGVHKKKFPVDPSFTKYIDLQGWRKNTPPFFFRGKEEIQAPVNLTKELERRVAKIKQGEVCFFSRSWKRLDSTNPWHTNPDSGYHYAKDVHWTQVQDYSKEAGDIKFVWEKARFSWLYDVIRYDYHSKENQAKFVFDQLEDFIDQNPINQGPQYKCSQEISLRVLNWTYALYYYKDDEYLTERLFQKIMHSIYWQVHHVYHNINFSRIAVRNNHAITETLMLYLSGKLFPFFPEGENWSKKGKKWFEEEVAYQIYPDGTFLQFSMNYHRVVIQLLTWGIRLSELNKDGFSEVVYKRAKSSLYYLESCMDPISGKMPNYGSNDGALFIKLNDDDYQVYRSQLDDLKQVLRSPISNLSESQFWYGFSKQEIEIHQNQQPRREVRLFKDGGYAVLQENTTRTFLRCGQYKDRPAQADNNHLDIWHEGINYLRDAGSYKYNTGLDELDYFMGTKGHNTVKLSGENQMEKGGRFIWYHWIKNALLKTKQTDKYTVLRGSFEGFKQIKKELWHHREVIKDHSSLSWEIIDTFEGEGNLQKEIFWHPNPSQLDNLHIEVTDLEGKKIALIENEGWYSGYYGVKEQAMYWSAKSTKGFITRIKIKD